MIKFEGDGEDLLSVDPQLILPASKQRAGIADNVQETFEETSSPGDDSAKPIRMEHCINLDMFLTPIADTMSTSSTDELHTPIMIFETPKELHRVNESTTHLQPSDPNPFTFPASAEGDANTAEINDHAESLEAGDSLLLSPQHFELDDINLDEYDFLTDYQDAILSELSASDIQLGDDSMKAINEQHNYALRLNLDNVISVGDDLQTPDILNTICSIANDFKLIEGHYISAEHVKQELVDGESRDTESVDSTEQPGTSISSCSSSVRPKSSRRRKNWESDDEEYIPPVSKRARRKEEAEEEEDEEEDVEVRSPKRGRPSKAVAGENEVVVVAAGSKYREMRDKNNEASRRSRRKRKVQEQTVEVERDELEARNERLKAQVAELEKSVSMYRSNLMVILLNKK